MNRRSSGAAGRHRSRLAAAAAALVLLCGATVPLPAAHATGQSAQVKTLPGWPGGIALYKGRYRLTSSGDASLAQSGMLTIFSRTVPHQLGPQMSGILALYTSNGTNVLYMTHFVHAGLKLSARVNLGIYTGPEIGTFAVVAHQGNDLTANFVPLSGATVSLHFSRISTNPHP